MTSLQIARTRIRHAHLRPDAGILGDLTAAHGPDAAERAAAVAAGTDLVRQIRARGTPGLMEVFLAEYGLSTDEGIALMCLAEALLRVPDAPTIDALIEDKIAPSAWGAHLGRSSSVLVNASTWALMLTGRVLREDGSEGLAATLHRAVKRVGEPVIRAAVGRAMQELGQQFVLGETIEDAIRRGQVKAALGYTFSYDMLGEAALTEADAQTFFDAYTHAIAALAAGCGDAIRDNPGISIKLSALHPRYEMPQRARVLDELVARTRRLAAQAAAANMGFNIDAEEADRLDLSLDVIAAVLADPALAGWDGFGVVIQAYGKRAGPVIDWVHALAERLDRRVMVRLVKGAYWDAEIKRAQVEGLSGFPVFSTKSATDVSFICCARQLLGLTDRIYPQFATHNAHSVASIRQTGAPTGAYEFQRLHGMGEALYDHLLESTDARCRIYAPVGAHRDLLAYLVRRLLENGANSSFVNQIVDEDVPPEAVAADPFGAPPPAHAVTAPADLYQPARRNARGWDLHDPVALAEFDAARQPFRRKTWVAAPLIAGTAVPAPGQALINPADPDDRVGEVGAASERDVETALAAATPWAAPVLQRARVLRRAADLYETHAGELFAVMVREAGKTPKDGVAELREAVDFLRYYAAEAEAAPAGRPRGRFVCISPWNFPLAIFTGQIAAALVTGNAVLAKPAETTPLTAAVAVKLMHAAGVPETALQLVPGDGPVVGAALAADPRVDGVCFTGSTATARAINRAMAGGPAPTAPLIAETGGLNAMIVDSTALPEQAVRDIVTSAFQSAGQRCSALRVLYLQEDIAEDFLTMLYGAMDALRLGDPWEPSTDIGPVIDQAARAGIDAHIAAARAEGRVLKALTAPDRGTFVAPTVIAVPGIAALEAEVFGPVLHIARYPAADLDKVVDAINATGFGLTFGMHSRIDDRVAQVTARVRAGNLYINRNQIGAIVGSQPFGGEGFSGTGPKAGGPHYLDRFRRPSPAPAATDAARSGRPAAAAQVARGLAAAAWPPAPNAAPLTLPGPTGESNRLSLHPRGPILCLGPGAAAATAQAGAVRAAGCPALALASGVDGADACDGALDPDALTDLAPLAAVISDAPTAAMRAALAKRSGPLVPLVTSAEIPFVTRLERHVCIDTTAAGGNATLLAQSG